MGLPLEDIQAIGAPVETEVISTSATVAYGQTIYDKNEILRLVGDDGHEIAFVREYVWPATLGNEFYDDPLAVWATDAEDAELAEKSWVYGTSATKTNITLDKTRAKIAKDFVMEFKLDAGTDDEVRSFLSPYGPIKNFYRPNPFHFPASTVLELEIRHLDDDDVSVKIEYQLRRETKVLQYWDGTNWVAGETWINITASTTEASFIDAITTDADVYPYSLAIRVEAARAAEFSHVSRVSIHETLTAGKGAYIAVHTTPIFVTPYRCRIAGIADNASKNLYVSRMGTQRFV